jgi:hypothetical protein
MARLRVLLEVLAVYGCLSWRQAYSSGPLPKSISDCSIAAALYERGFFMTIFFFGKLWL